MSQGGTWPRDGLGIDATASWDLVAAAARGDRGAFGRLYGRYVGPVSRFVASRVADRALAEDLTSETFLRALRRIGSVHDQGRDVGAWFTTIARNLVLDHLKSSRHQREWTAAEVPERPTAPAVAGPEQSAIDRDTAERLRRCVAQLSADQRDCVRLRYVQDLSSAQTAAVMGRSELAVRGLRHRAVARLREAMTSDPHDRRLPGQARPQHHTRSPAGEHERSGTADGSGGVMGQRRCDPRVTRPDRARQWSQTDLERVDRTRETPERGTL